MGFQLTMTLGDLVQLIGFIVTAYRVYHLIDRRIVIVETKVDAMWDRRERARS